MVRHAYKIIFAALFTYSTAISATSYDRGYNHSMASNQKGLVVEVHQANDEYTAPLMSDLGTYSSQDHAISFIENKNYNSGSNPTIAFINDHQVISTWMDNFIVDLPHDHYAIGNIQNNSIHWLPQYGYDLGRDNGAVGIGDNHIILLHSHVDDDSEENQSYVDIAKVMQDGELQKGNRIFFRKVWLPTHVHMIATQLTNNKALVIQEDGHNGVSDGIYWGIIQRDGDNHISLERSGIIHLQDNSDWVWADANNSNLASITANQNGEVKIIISGLTTYEVTQQTKHFVQTCTFDDHTNNLDCSKKDTMLDWEGEGGYISSPSVSYVEQKNYIYSAQYQKDDGALEYTVLSNSCDKPL